MHSQNTHWHAGACTHTHTETNPRSYQYYICLTSQATVKTTKTSIYFAYFINVLPCIAERVIGFLEYRCWPSESCLYCNRDSFFYCCCYHFLISVVCGRLTFNLLFYTLLQIYRKPTWPIAVNVWLHPQSCVLYMLYFHLSRGVHDKYHKVNETRQKSSKGREARLWCRKWPHLPWFAAGSIIAVVRTWLADFLCK